MGVQYRMFTQLEVETARLNNVQNALEGIGVGFIPCPGRLAHSLATSRQVARV